MSGSETSLSVFVSSIMNLDIEDLRDERTAAKESILRIGLAKPWLFEHSPASANYLTDEYLAKVKQCDFFISILGSCITRAVANEFAVAKLHRRPMLVFVKDMPNRNEDCKSFIKSIETKWVKYVDINQFRELVEKSVQEEIIKRVKTADIQIGPEAILADIDLLRVKTGENLKEEIQTSIGPKFIPELYTHRAEQEELLQIIRDGGTRLTSLRRDLAHKVFTYIFADLSRQINTKLKLCEYLLKESSLAELSYNIGKVSAELPKDISIDCLKTQLLSMILVEGQAGNGKTNLLCQCALITSKTQVVVFINGSSTLHDEHDVERRILESMGINCGQEVDRWLTYVFDCLSRNQQQIIVFIDAINENSNFRLMIKSLLRCLRSKYAPMFRFILSCRDISWTLSYSNSDLREYVLIKMHLGEFTEIESNQAIVKYLNTYKLIVNLGKSALLRLRHPLLLRFFCEAYHDANNKTNNLGPIDDFSLKSVFDLYWKNKLANIQGMLQHSSSFRAENMLKSFVFKMMKTKTHEVFLKDIISAEVQNPESETIEIFQSLLDEYIIIESTNQNKIRFVYEEFMAYVMGRYIASELEGIPTGKYRLKKLQSLFHDAISFQPIFAAVGYAALFLEKGYSSDIWNMLIEGPISAKAVAAKNLQQLFIESFSIDMYKIVVKLVKAEPRLSGIEKLILSLERYDEQKAFSMWQIVALADNLEGIKNISKWNKKYPQACQKILAEIITHKLSEAKIYALDEIAKCGSFTDIGRVERLIDDNDFAVRLSAALTCEKLWGTLANCVIKHESLQSDLSIASLALELLSHKHRRNQGEPTFSLEDIILSLSTKLSICDFSELMHLRSIFVGSTIPDIQSDEMIQDCLLRFRKIKEYSIAPMVFYFKGSDKVKIYVRAFPSSEDISEYCLSLERSNCCNYNLRQAYDIDLELIEDETMSLNHIIPDDNNNVAETAEKNALREELEKILGTLKPIEKSIIASHFGLEDGREYTTKEIAKNQGITEPQVRNIESRALKKLLDPAQSNNLMEFI